MDIILRRDAKARGLTRYFTGVPCPKGHVGPRSVSNAACVDCSSLSSAARNAELMRDPVALAARRARDRELAPRYRDRKRTYDKRYDASPARVFRTQERYNLSPSQYAELLTSQGGVCAICAQPPGRRRLFVDHDHACCAGRQSCGRCVRALLCVRCNSMLGHAQDNPARLTAGIAYLTKHQRNAS